MYNNNKLAFALYLLQITETHLIPQSIVLATDYISLGKSQYTIFTDHDLYVNNTFKMYYKVHM